MRASLLLAVALCSRLAAPSLASHAQVGISAKQPHPAGAAVPGVLQHIYVAIAFHWDVLQLIYLRQVVQAIDAYPTEVELCISSNEPERLRAALKGWGNPDWVCGWEEYLEHPYHLAHVHRQQMVSAAKNPAYTCFMYLEHDMLVSWRALLAWAADNALLEPRGFQRGFYRVENGGHTGQLGLTDQIEPLNISAWNETLAVPPGPAGAYEGKHFLRLPVPYCAVWVASRAKVHAFMRSPQWNKKEHPWEVRAMGAGGLQFVDVPKGFWSAALVPYSAASGRHLLDPAAAIHHLTNKYCAENTQTRKLLRKWERHLLCTINVDRYIIT